LPNRELFKIFDRLEEINKPFQYRQGLDIRLLSKERIERLLNLKYDGGSGGFTYYFSFDLWEYKELIEKNLKMLSEAYFYRKPDVKWIRTKMYCFCGFLNNNKNTNEFWLNDLEYLFKRFEIIFKYKSAPYVMKHEDYKKSPYAKIYNEIANYANGMGGTVLNMSFNEYIETSHKNTSEVKIFRDKNPQFKKLFDLKL
jgi:hypothetical protein